MKRIFLLVLIVSLLVGCGGGGGGGGGGNNVQVTGRVLSVSTGSPPNPVATVQIGTRTGQTGASDGLFAFQAPIGSASVIVLSSFPTFTFLIPALTAATDLGDLWIGTQTITLQGTVINANTSDPIDGATVRFGGHVTTTNASGAFSISGVAYDGGSEFVFFGIVGKVQKTGFVPADFNANQSPIAGIVSLPPIAIAPVSDPNPPGSPGNLVGTVSLQGGGNPSGATVTLLDGATPIRQVTVGTDGRYKIWAAPSSTYTLRFAKSGFTTQDVPITGFISPSQVITTNVTLAP